MAYLMSGNLAPIPAVTAATPCPPSKNDTNLHWKPLGIGTLFSVGFPRRHPLLMIYSDGPLVRNPTSVRGCICCIPFRGNGHDFLTGAFLIFTDINSLFSSSIRGVKNIVKQTALNNSPATTAIRTETERVHPSRPVGEGG